jgi:hypothetical protein
MGKLFFYRYLEDENIHLDLSTDANIRVEKEKEFTHFEIWSSVGCHYIKISTSQLEQELKKYEI